MYRMNFMMMHHYKYDIKMFDHMLPFEREIYINMLIEQIESDKARYSE